MEHPPFIGSCLEKAKEQFTHPLGSYGFLLVFSWFSHTPILGHATVPPWCPPESWHPTAAQRAEPRRSRSFRRCEARGGDGTPECSARSGKGRANANFRKLRLWVAYGFCIPQWSYHMLPLSFHVSFLLKLCHILFCFPWFITISSASRPVAVVL